MVITIYCKKIRNCQHLCFRNVNFQHDKVVPDHRICYKSWSFYVLSKPQWIFFNSRWRRQDGPLNIGKSLKMQTLQKYHVFYTKKLCLIILCNKHKWRQYYLFKWFNAANGRFEFKVVGWREWPYYQWWNKHNYLFWRFESLFSPLQGYKINTKSTTLINTFF